MLRNHKQTNKKSIGFIVQIKAFFFFLLLFERSVDALNDFFRVLPMYISVYRKIYLKMNKTTFEKIYIRFKRVTCRRLMQYL